MIQSTAAPLGRSARSSQLRSRSSARSEAMGVFRDASQHLMKMLCHAEETTDRGGTREERRSESSQLQGPKQRIGQTGRNRGPVRANSRVAKAGHSVWPPKDQKQFGPLEMRTVSEPHSGVSSKRRRTIQESRSKTKWCSSRDFSCFIRFGFRDSAAGGLDFKNRCGTTEPAPARSQHRFGLP